MIALSIGKKGSGKTALVRKLASRAIQQKRAIFYHDPQAQIVGTTYESADEWRADPRPDYLSVFRGCDVEEVASLALRVKDVTLVVDEMDRACAGKKWLSNSVHRIVHEGRHFRTSLFGTFRRTANVSEDLLSQVDYCFLFRMTNSSPWDLQTVRTRFGDAYANAVQTLDHGQFVIWKDD